MDLARSIYRKVLPLKARKIVRGTIERLSSRFDRRAVAYHYLRGEGIEIGALNSPLVVPKSAKVRYVDRMTVSDLREEYAEIDRAGLVNPDIIDDGELLGSIPDASQDFVIANHFIEHCQNPIMALGNMFRVLRGGGILYLAIPDKRYTFDADRPVTTLEHILEDYERGPEWSKRQHYEEWSQFVGKAGGEERVKALADNLISRKYSIHFHVWTQAEMFDLIALLKRRLGLVFDVELFLKNGLECIFILRKGGEEFINVT